MKMDNRAGIRVSYFQRKPRSIGNYSVEFIFKDVRQQLAEQVDAREVYSTFESSGLFRRIYNCIEAIGRQAEINHVTGDINYIGLFLNNGKTVQTILDCVHLSSSTGIRHAILKLFWVTIPVRRARFVTAISESTKNEILKYVQCDPDKIKVIPVAISAKFVQKGKTFDKGNPRLLQLGTAPNKNIPRLAEALRGIPCTLDIVGRQDTQLEESLKKNGIRYQYSWGLSDAEIINKYEQADIITLVSTYEGFGMPILEGQAVGRPVISSNVYSMPEVAGDAACLVDPFNTQSIRQGIQKIINDADYRTSLVQKGYENVKRFDSHTIALKYLDLYKAIRGES